MNYVLINCLVTKYINERQKYLILLKHTKKTKEIFIKKIYFQKKMKFYLTYKKPFCCSSFPRLL